MAVTLQVPVRLSALQRKQKIRNSTTLQSLFRARILRFYGRISFGLYLVHFYLLPAVATNMALPDIVKAP